MKARQRMSGADRKSAYNTTLKEEKVTSTHPSKKKKKKERKAISIL